MKFRSLSSLFGAALLATQLVACKRPVARPEAPLPMVKLVTPDTTAEGDYHFAALVRQARRADLSFETGGMLASMLVDAGDVVSLGQVLARIDPQPARLQVAQAEANVRSTAGQLQERRDQLSRQQTMHADGAISALTLEAAQVALTMADAAHSAATSALQVAVRAQRLSVLRAPFAGRIKARLVEPGTLAVAGQSVLQIEGEGHPQVVADLPVALLPASLKPGAVVSSATNQATVRITGETSAQEPVQLTLRSLSTHINAGGTVQAIFDLRPDQAPRRSGEALSIRIASGAPQVLMLPLTAVAQDTVDGTGHVFVLHRPGNVLERRPVRLGRQRGDSIEVTQGLGRAEEVAGAGTAFLVDRERVARFQPTSRLAVRELP